MIKIYTPQNWFSYFSNVPSLIIDDGYIYNEEGYRQFVKEKIGKIDAETGYIYGEDFYRLGAQPIGVLKEDGPITEVYGDDYYEHGASPILYILENTTVYTPEEYFKSSFTRQPALYIEENETPKAIPVTDSAPVPHEKNQVEESPSSRFGIVAGILVAVSLICSYGWITGAWNFGRAEYIAIFISIIVGGIVAFFTSTGGCVFLVTEGIGAVLLWIIAAIADFVIDGFSFTWIIVDLLLGLLVTIPYCAFPALIASVVIILIQKILSKLNRT